MVPIYCPDITAGGGESNFLELAGQGRKPVSRRQINTMAETENNYAADLRFNTSFSTARKEEYQDLTLNLPLSPQREDELFRLSHDPDFVKRKIAATNKDQFRQVSNVIDLVADDLYIAQNKWAETPEELGKLAGRLEAHGRWNQLHGRPGEALMDYRRELRIVKSCVGEKSELAQLTTLVIDSLQNPVPYYLWNGACPVMPPWRLPVK